MLSIVIITKNEQEYIDKFLSHILSCVDEIIIIDDFSTDDTIKIAKKYTDKIFKRKFDNFSAQRNFGIKKAKNKWILSLDPDEIVSEELKVEIFDKIKENKFDAFYIPFKHYWFGDWLKHGFWYPSYLKRLFKKDKCIWENEVHEILKVNGKIGYLKNAIEHYGHEDVIKVLRKIFLYTKQEISQRENSNKIPTIFGPLKTFINRYIIRLGFLDGYRGFIVNFFMFFYVFLIKVRFYEKRLQNES